MRYGRHDHTQPEELLTPAGGVIVPPALAGAVRAALLGHLAGRARRDGLPPGPGVTALVWALDAAARGTQPAPSSDNGTPAAASPIVEISAVDAASLLGCSVEYARRLCRSGVLRCRRVGRAWLVDRASLDAWRHGTTEAP
ncbi:helix-turn-helix domain-containing protein [Actinoplanes sp. NPDC049316]|uniref:helix-turn-helix domain-containing protein n=1 Tax=Actinoplanes sp. NPDC049316 TaxID=3154727 RepID=UPI003419E029